jgi:hypothetical protein
MGGVFMAWRWAMTVLFVLGGLHRWEHKMWFSPKHEVVVVTDESMRIENVREDAPAFKRIYKGHLDARCSITVTMKTSYGSRYKSGELTQPNGRWVLFDPDEVADKILDPVLVPLVQSFCDAAEVQDKAFIQSDPREFSDEHGARWVRQ